MSYRNKKTNSSIYIYFFCLIVGIAILNKLSRIVSSLMSTNWILIIILITFLLITICYGFNQYNKHKYYKSISLSEIDTMTGIQFEEYLINYFGLNGYSTNSTPKSNDYGADIILYKDSTCTVIQAKRYNSKVGIKAVQEVLAAKSYYHANEGIVITNNYYTSQAINLARRCNIQLWDREKLKTLLYGSTQL